MSNILIAHGFTLLSNVCGTYTFINITPEKFNFDSIDIRVLINSIILAPISWSWVFKPIAKRMNWDYKDFDNKLNN